MLTLDKQLSRLPKEVQFCRNCVVSNQRPRTSFNENGICSACQWSEEKDFLIDWKEREKELQDLCNRHRSSTGAFDVIVPGSGGKDSAFVAHQLKHRFGMHPLCVTWAPFGWTDIGWQNLQTFISKGFHNLIAQPPGDFHRKLARLAFELKGDAFEPFVYGQQAWAFHAAEKFNIPLIFYGENGEVEYGGNMHLKNEPKESPDNWEEAYFKGAGVRNLLDAGLENGLLSNKEWNETDLTWYLAPPPERLQDKKIELHFYSYYQKWTPQENFYYAATHTGFETNPKGRSEGTYTKYVSLDDRSDGFHFYLSYMKFGLGRASRDAQQDIRRHHITRSEGVRLVHRYDGEFPKEHFNWFLNYLNISEERFWQVMDFYRQQSNVWEKIDGEWKLKHLVSDL